MKRLALIFTLLLASFSMQGQTFYELQFTHPVDGKRYLGLMTYFSDERCKRCLLSELTKAPRARCGNRTI